jgi:cytochrome c biogenesis protein CcmG/thiol:disulfide interchange protein DsbE
MAKHSSRPYAYALLGVVFLVFLAWLNPGRFSAVAPGVEAPNFQARDLKGNPVELKDHTGKVVMVNIWATWCAPCLEEMPSIERLYKEFHSSGLEIMAVSVDAEIGKVDASRNQVGGDIQAFGDSLNLTFPLLHDPSGSIEQLYKITGVPETFVIGRDGVIYKKVAGGTEWDASEHKDLLKRLLEMTQ